MRKTWIVGIVLVLIALPAMAQDLSAKNVGVGEEVSCPAEEPGSSAQPEAGELEPPAAPEVPIEPFSVGFELEKPASGESCPVLCVNSYCADEGIRCTISGCNVKHQCCFYDCAPDPSCTSFQGCPASACFCALPQT